MIHAGLVTGYDSFSTYDSLLTSHHLVIVPLGSVILSIK